MLGLVGGPTLPGINWGAGLGAPLPLFFEVVGYKSGKLLLVDGTFIPDTLLNLEVVGFDLDAIPVCLAGGVAYILTFEAPLGLAYEG